MANKTFLNLVNRVQRRMRETVTASVTTNAYSTLIGEFVNEAKREVEDAWNWNALRETIIATTAANTRAYVLTNAGKRFRVLDVYNDTSNYLLYPIGTTEQTVNFLDSVDTVNKPLNYSFNGEFEGDPVVDLYPIPDGVYSINFNLVVPQVDLVANTDELYVPDYPVYLGAVKRALEERGEDGSQQYATISRDYANALADAVSQDEARMPTETDWYAR
jgi:hypothetical protein